MSWLAKVGVAMVLIPVFVFLISQVVSVVIGVLEFVGALISNLFYTYIHGNKYEKREVWMILGMTLIIVGFILVAIDLIVKGVK